MACVAVNSLMRTIELEFLQPCPRPILQEYELISPCNKELIQSLHGKLGSLMKLFDKSRMDGVEAIKLLETRLKDVAFRVEDEIEVQVVELYEDKELKNPQWGKYVAKKWNLLRLHCILKQAIQDIDKIKEELVKVKNKYEQNIKDLQQRKTALDVLPKPDEVTMMGDSSQHASHCKEIMIGKHNDFKIIMKMLIEYQSKQLQVVFIKGMGGIGKTVLARQIYKDPLIVSHFDKRAWAVASQHHDKRQMLASLLNSMGYKKSRDDEDQAVKLYQSLKGQRYLVVIDDIWSVEAWDAVKACFPDEGNHSRVLFTTRIAGVAKNIASSNEFSQQMDLLDQRESWDLFCKKTCKCGVEFEKIGRPIVEKCKGLPLAIVVVAGLLSKLNTLDEWKNIVEVLNSSATSTIDEECSRIFSLSYNHLPHNLKACFLYLGVFPADHEIYANELARLWSVEGLVKEVKNESFFEVANKYIQELMDRNLIILSKLSCCGRKIKKFRMHDLVHDFCEREAQNENLLHVVRENGSNFPQKDFRWVSIQSVNFEMCTLLSSSKSCRSFFRFMHKDRCLNLENWNLLRAVYVDDDAAQLLESMKIGGVVHLRYLLSRYYKTDNVEMGRAWNLQTLKIGRVEGKFLEFPQLQHIYCDTFDGILPKIVDVISWLEAEYCRKEYIINIPYLKKAHINIPERSDIKDLVYLNQLQRLVIYGDGPQTLSDNHIVLFKNLRKLSIRDMGFYWEEISALSTLPKLQILKLSNTSIGTQWELSEEEIFSELIFLKIDSYDLEYWGANNYHFPKLERLLLYRCRQLREIPTDFAEISTLTSIELRSCLPSAVESAKQIRDDQHDYGNDNMVVIEEYTEERNKYEIEGPLRAKGLITDWWQEYYSRW